MITHKEVTDLLKLTMLIYNYGKEIFAKRDESMSQDNVIYRLEKVVDLQSSPVELNAIRLEAYKELREESPEGSVVKFINDEETDLQAAITISHNHKRISVIFRGTESFSDWYYNFIIFKKWIFDKVYVHSGFYKQLTKNNAYSDLTATLKNLILEYPDYKIYTCGHCDYNPRYKNGIELPILYQIYSTFLSNRSNPLRQENLSPEKLYLHSYP